MTLTRSLRMAVCWDFEQKKPDRNSEGWRSSLFFDSRNLRYHSAVESGKSVWELGVKRCTRYFLKLHQACFQLTIWFVTHWWSLQSTSLEDSQAFTLAPRFVCLCTFSPVLSTRSGLRCTQLTAFLSSDTFSEAFLCLYRWFLVTGNKGSSNHEMQFYIGLQKTKHPS